MRFVLCDFLRRDVKCRRYIQPLILHNIFICASTQNPLGLTIKKSFPVECVIFGGLSKKQTIEGEICVL